MSDERDKRSRRKKPAQADSPATISIDQLETFMALVAKGGVERAAHALSIDESTLRDRVNNLEKWLGKTLFTRRPTYRITAEGRAFFQVAYNITCSLYDFRHFHPEERFERLLAIKGTTLEKASGGPKFNSVTGETEHFFD